MLHAGLDLSRKRLDYCLISEEGVFVDEGAVSPDAGGLADVTAAIESMTGVADGGGNRARDNGNPLQCTNVFCK